MLLEPPVFIRVSREVIFPVGNWYVTPFFSSRRREEMSWVFHVKAERVEEKRDNARNEVDNFIVNYIREIEGNRVVNISPRV